MRHPDRKFTVQILILSTVLASSTAQSQPNIYADPSNLKVLPADISAEDLRQTMRSFAIDTGHRCTSCHVGEEGQAMTEHDFASDEKPLKAKARAMMKLVASINRTHLAEYGEDHVPVRCVTCHRGLNKPLLTGDVLAEAADEGGVEAMLAEYRALRERYYGTHSFDFSPLGLSEVAAARGRAGHPEQARALFDALVEEEPGSFMVHYSYGEFLREQGEVEQAIAQYEQAIEANPGATGFLQGRIRELQGPQE